MFIFPIRSTMAMQNMKWLNLILILSSVGISCIRSTSAHNAELPSSENINDSESVHSLFRDFEEKTTELWKCDGWHGGMKWRIPNKLDCSLSTEVEEAKVVAITVYWTDISKQTVQGYECYAEKTEGWIYRNFWEAVTKDTKKYKLSVSQEACWSMVHLNKAPDGRELRQTSGVYGTFETLKIKSSWWYNASATVTNYYFLPLKIAVLELDSSIQSVTVFQKPCLYHESYCLTELGILVWNVKDIKTCRLKEGENTRCILSRGSSGNRLTCPELELSLHDLHHVKLCNHTFGASSQGIYFAQNEIGEYDSELVTPKELLSIISAPKQRSRRAANYAKVSSQDAFINAKFNYMYEVVTNHTVHAIQKILQDVCKSNQKVLDTVRYMAETGHPTLITRFIFGESCYRASFSGDVLSIWQCLPIRQYKFLPREICTLEWPVSFVYNDNVMTGYMVPLSHTIISTPTLRPEPCLEFYFDTGDYVYHLSNNGATVVHLPTLPKPGDDHKQLKYFPDLSFKSSSGFDITELTDVGHTYSLLRDAQARANHIKILETRIEEMAQPLTPIRLLWTSFITVVSGIPTFAKYVIGVLSIGTVFITAMMLGFKIAIFGNILNAIKIPFITLFSKCCELKEKVRRSKAEKKKRKNHIPSEFDNESSYINQIPKYDAYDYIPSAPSMDSFQVSSEPVRSNRKWKGFGYKKTH